MTDLYSLNKDMLIKLVATIQQNTIQEYENKMEVLKERIRLHEELNTATDNNLYIFNCKSPNCSCLWGIAPSNHNCYSKCKEFFCCVSCHEVFCNFHIKDSICLDCFNLLNNK